MRSPDWRASALRLKALANALAGSLRSALAELDELRADLTEAAPLLFEHRRKRATCVGKPNCGGTPTAFVKGKWLCHWCHTAPKKKRPRKPKESR